MTNKHIDYLEFKSHDLEQTKSFYNQCFNWKFTDYGPTYVAFENSGLQGGFELTSNPIQSSILPVLYHNNLEEIQTIIIKNGGKIVKDIFSFPGGKRFHFEDPSGNELAIWSE